MPKINPGGHAIMLAVRLPVTIRNTMTFWANSKDGRVCDFENAHCTVLFAGNDLSVETGLRMMGAAQELDVEMLPKELISTGRYSMFGAQRDTAVVLVEKTPELARLRHYFTERLGSKSTFAFTPHVSLGKGASYDSPCRLRHTATHATICKIEVAALLVKAGSRTFRVKTLYNGEWYGN